MTPQGPPPSTGLPESVRDSLDEFRERFGFDLRLWSQEGDDGRVRLYPGPPEEDGAPETSSLIRRLELPDGRRLQLELRNPGSDAEGPLDFLASTLRRSFRFDREIRFFTRELSERYEEINLLYSISEILASILTLEDAAELILREVCDVLEARRGSLWVHDADADRLHLVASVGAEGLDGPLDVDDAEAVTPETFRESEPRIFSRLREDSVESVVSVPIRYTPRDGTTRTLGVVNLFGRRHEEEFTGGEQKLLSAIASQIGSAVETNRLVQESLRQERVTREMELAHDLQMKLLPAVEVFEGAEAAARCEPAESVGGDFYHLLRLPRGRIGVMIGDVSSHGFPAALIMALVTSAAGIYAQEVATPAEVLGRLHAALRDELVTTEMYLTLFYGLLDPEAGSLTYANAGHPHAFRIPLDGEEERLLATDPPLGIAGETDYHQVSVPWERGKDLLLLFTDGLSDTLACRSRGDGEECVVREARAMSGEAPESIVRRLFSLASRAEPPVRADDRTALLVRA